MESAKLLYERIGDLVVLDVGGATTDLHSVTVGSEEISRIQISPEPVAKRTVEGDLGVYVNMRNIVDIIGKEALEKELGPRCRQDNGKLQSGPVTDDEFRFVERLTREAVFKAAERHAGRIRYVYGPSGRTTLAEGKDLTQIKFIIGTGGALSRLPHRVEIMQEIAKRNETGLLLFPGEEAQILVDNDYIMASLGVLAKRHPDAALYFLEKSLDHDLSPVRSE